MALFDCSSNWSWAQPHTTSLSTPFLRASAAHTDLWVRNRSRQSCSLARHDDVRASRRVVAVAAASGQVDQIVLTNLPQHIPVVRDELAIWRAFLAAEIDAILHDEKVHADHSDGETSC